MRTNSHGFLGGLLANARAAAPFAAPTLNGYKRYHGVNTMAPIQAVWAQDNRGAIVRVLGAPGDPATHLENRPGEPVANPYLYMASQIYPGLDGIARRLDPGPSADAPAGVPPSGCRRRSRRRSRRCARMPVSVPASASPSCAITRTSRKPRLRAPAKRPAPSASRPRSRNRSSGNISTCYERVACA